MTIFLNNRTESLHLNIRRKSLPWETSKENTMRSSSKKAPPARRTWLISLITERRCKQRPWWWTTKTRFDACSTSRGMIATCRLNTTSGILPRSFTFPSSHFTAHTIGTLTLVVGMVMDMDMEMDMNMVIILICHQLVHMAIMKIQTITSIQV